MRMLGTIALWLVSIVALLVTLAAGALFYFTAIASPYPQTWIALVSVVSGLLFSLWTNPLCRHLIKQRGRPLRGWLVGLALLMIVPAGMFAENYFRSTSPRYLVAQGQLAESEDPHRAADFFGRACTANFGPGCTSLGQIHSTGLYAGPLPDAAASERAYERGCDLGEAYSCLGLSLQLPEEFPNDPSVHARARDYRFRSCELQTAGWRGNEIGATACAIAGAEVLGGSGVTRDLARAQRFLESACLPNPPSGFEHNAEACISASRTMATLAAELARTDVSRAREAARIALRQAKYGCEESTDNDCTAYGTLLARGVVASQVVVLAPSPAEAEPILQEACHAHDINACSIWQRISSLPDGPIQRALAQCESNYPGGCIDAGTMYEFGVTVPPNVARSASLYGQACRQLTASTARLVGFDECYPSAVLALYGTGLDAPQPTEARRLLGITCEMSDSPDAQVACVQLGDMRIRGEGGVVDRDGALSAYRRAVSIDDELVFAAIAQSRLRVYQAH